MALVTQLLVRIQGNADGLISALAKTGKTGRDAFKEVSAGAKVEFEKARREADRLYKDVARLEKEAATHARAGRTDLSGALLGQASARKVEADTAAAAVIAAERRIAAESIKTGQITKTALAGGASGAGAAFAREGGAISRVLGTVRAEATKTGVALKTGLSSGAFEGIGKSAAVAGAGILAGFGVAAKATLTFDKALSGVAAASGATGKALGLLRDAALTAGKETVFTATEAAAAQGELARAGVTVKDILGGGLKGALSLAAAGQLEVADAARISAVAMNQFGLSGKDVQHVADVLAGAAFSSQAEVQDLAQALQQSGQVAHEFGVSFEDTATALTVFSKAGLNASDAGTSLRTLFTRLADPAGEARKALARFNIEAYDSKGAFKGLGSLAGELQQKLGPLTQATRNQALAQIFGTDAFRAATVLMNQGAGGFAKVRTEVLKTGDATKIAAIQMDNLSGDLERLKGSIESGLIGAGSGATGVLRGIAGSAEDAANAFAGLPAGVQGTVGVLAGLSGTALAAAGAIGFLAPKIQAGRVALEGLGQGGIIASKGLGLLGKVGGAAVGIFAIATALDALGDKIVQLSVGSANIGEIGKGLVDLGQKGKASGALAREFGDDLGKLADKVKTVTSFSKTGKLDILHPTAFKNAKGDIEALDKALTDLAASGPAGADAAKRSFDALAAAAGKEGVSRKDLLKQLNDYAKATTNAELQSKLAADGIGKTGNAAKDAAGGVSDMATNTGALSAAAEDAATQLNGMLEQLTSLTGLNLSVSDSNIRFIQSLGEMKKSLVDNGKSFDVNTEAGQKNQSALNDAISAANAHATAVGEQTGSIEFANATLQGHRARLIEAAASTGIARDEATRLVDALLQIKSPPPVAVSADTQPARDALEAFMRDQQRRELVIKTRFVPGDTVAFGTGQARFSGGPVDRDKPYEVGERGAELFVPARNTPGALSAAAHLATRAEKESRDGLVRLGIPGGIEPKQSRKGTQALLLGKDGPQTFVPPTDGVVVRASDTARLMRTEDEDIIARILKRAGADKRTLDALVKGPDMPARASGGRVQQGERYKVNEKGTEAFVPTIEFNSPRQATPSVKGPGVKRGSDGTYTISIGDTNLVVEAGTSGSTKGVSKSQVDKIVERKQAELVAELTAAIRSSG